MSKENKQDDGRAALPHETPFEHVGDMTLLDYFAGQALAGLCADPEFGESYDDMANLCYQQAAAMIAEKRRREEGVE